MFSLIIFVDCRAFGQLPFLFIELDGSVYHRLFPEYLSHKRPPLSVRWLGSSTALSKN